MSTIVCHHCQESNKESALFCAACGKKLVQLCFNCQNEMSLKARFCDQCGTSLTRTAPKPASEKEKTSGSYQIIDDAERRHLTVMFCDLADSTRLSQILDAEDLREIIKQYQGLCSMVVQQNGGHIAQYLGDGILIYFGFPKAFEDSAPRAIRSGLEILKSINYLNLSLEKTYNTTLSLRIAIHSGVVVVGEMGGGKHREQLAMGQVPNVAARLERLADKNTIIISQDTYRLVQNYFKCISLGPKKLKGIKEEVKAYKVTGEISSKTHIHRSFQNHRHNLVGREAEKTHIFGLWENAKEGYGQVLFLNGEAGIGKSRLLFEFKKDVIKENNFRLIESQCSQYHRTRSLHPIIESFKYDVFQPEPKSSNLQKLKRIENYGQQFDYNLKVFVPLIAPYLSIVIPERYPPIALNPDKRKEMVFQFLLDYLLKQSANKTLLFIVEDLHWTDPITLEFLSLLVDQVKNKKVFSIFSYRPQFKSPWLTGTAHFNYIELSRLKPRQIKQMISPLTSAKTLPAKILDQLIQKTDGIPLFIEEWTRMILESDMVEEQETSFQLKENFSERNIPSTLHDSLMARLDKLGHGKRIAQFGSVVGRSFTLSLMEHCAPFSKEDLHLALKKLVRAQILLIQEDDRDKVYFFKHALIQEVAYHSLLRKDKKHFHLLVAEAMEKELETLFIDNQEVIANHFAEAENPQKAIKYWKKAAIRANKKYSPSEEIEYLSRSLKQTLKIEDVPKRKKTELELLLMLGPAYLDAKGYHSPEVEKTYQKAEVLCSEIGSEDQLFSVLYGLYMSYSIRTKFDYGQIIIEKMLQIASNSKVENYNLVAHNIGGFQAFFLGRFKSALKHSLSVLKLYHREKHASLSKHFGHDLGVFSHCFSARALWTLGYPDKALQHIQSALTLANGLGQPYSLAIAHKLAASVHKLRCEPEPMFFHANKALSISKKHNFHWIYSVGLIWKASALTSLKGPSAGLPLFKEAFELIEKFKSLQGTPHYLTFYAEALIASKRYSEALKIITKALKIIENSKESWYQAELYRLKAKVFVIINNDARAEKDFLKSIQIARYQDAKSWELRTSIDLASLEVRQGKVKLALDRLKNIHKSFSEGFETKDLLICAARIDNINAKNIII